MVKAAEPLLVVHGFPTSSHDFHLVVDRLAADRRVLLVDLVGFGLSAKPDLAYWVDLHADVVAAFVRDSVSPGSRCSPMIWATPWAASCSPARPRVAGRSTSPGGW